MVTDTSMQRLCICTVSMRARPLTRGLRVVRYGLVESCLCIAHCERATVSLLFERAPVKIASGILLRNMEL